MVLSTLIEKKNKKNLWLSIFLPALGILFFLPSLAQAANCGGAVQCQCGDTLTESQTMWYDFNNCPGTGLNISANNLTLDCNSHIIDGVSAGYGISLSDNQQTAISNCNIREFGSGLRLYSSANNNFSNNTMENNTGLGISFMGLNDNNNIFNNNTVQYNGQGGISASYTGNTFMENLVNNNTGYGISSSGSNTLTENIIHDNTGYGIYFTGSNGNLNGNNISGNAQGGIYLSGANNIVSGNNINANGQYGINLNPTNSTSNNQIIDNLIEEHSIYDINVNFWSSSLCANTIENNTGSGGRPIKYLTAASTLANLTLSELILCNADGSNFNNVTISGSENLQNNGIVAYYTDNTSLTLINSSNNYRGISGKNNSYFNVSNSNLSGNISEGINIDTCNNNIFIGNSMSNDYRGLLLTSCSNNIIQNNTTNNNAGTGIYLGGSTNTVTGNTSNNNNSNGILLSGGSGSAVIGNTTNNNNSNNPNYSGYGILLYQSNSNIVQNNIANNNIRCGIAVMSAGNSVLNNVTNYNNEDGILVISWDNNVLTNNVSHNNADSGISLHSSSNNQISQNDIYGNQQYGLYLMGAFSIVGTNNYFWSNSISKNTINAWVEVNGNYYSNGNLGNYWDDFANNPGYPNSYVVSGPATGVDYHPTQMYLMDNSDRQFRVLSGQWSTRDFTSAYNGNIRFNNQGSGGESAIWRSDNYIMPGNYEVYVWKFAHEYSDRMATNAHYKVQSATGTSDWILVNQATPGNEWISLGTYEFNNSGQQGVILSDEANGYIGADAVKLVRVSN